MFDSLVYRDLETRVRATQGYRNQHVLIRHLFLTINVP